MALLSTWPLFLKATECSFYLGVAGKFAAFGLGEAGQKSREVRSINTFRFDFIAAQRQHCESDFVLRFRRQVPHNFESFVQKARHVCRMLAFLYKMKTTANGETQ